MSVANQNALERIISSGVRSAGIIDLLAVVLARRSEDVEQCEVDASILAKKFHGARILDLAAADLKATCGLENFEAVQRLAAMELGRRAADKGKGNSEPLPHATSVFAMFKHLSVEKQEHFCAAYLDSKGNLISKKTIHIGTINMSVVGAREVFREAVRENAASLIVVHNHPSGDPTPSPEDYSVTRKLVEVGRLLDIPLLDHVIIGHDRYISLQEEGVL